MNDIFILDYFVLFWFVLVNILTVISLTSSAYLCYYIKVYSESNVLF